jgi:hypothetical protein
MPYGSPILSENSKKGEAEQPISGQINPNDREKQTSLNSRFPHHPSP